MTGACACEIDVADAIKTQTMKITGKGESKFLNSLCEDGKEVFIIIP
jgi:hypothetical protein